MDWWYSIMSRYFDSYAWDKGIMCLTFIDAFTLHIYICLYKYGNDSDQVMAIPLKYTPGLSEKQSNIGECASKPLK